MPELNFVFNVVHDVFILKAADQRETVIYGVFTSQWSVVRRLCAGDHLGHGSGKGKSQEKAL